MALGLTESIGTNSADTLPGPANTAVFGLRGADALAGNGQAENVWLMGGSDDDTYNEPNDGYTIVYETGDSSNDLVIADAVSLQSNDTRYELIDDRHLFFFDPNTGTGLILADWQTEANRIENFQFADGDLDFDGLVDAVADRGTTATTWEDALPTSATTEEVDAALIEFAAQTQILENYDQTAIEQMVRLYNAAFGRSPDDGGLAFWVTYLQEDGNTLESAANLFLGTPEAQQRFGANPTNEELVDAFYQNVLGREGDEEGRNFWITNLENGTFNRPTVLAAFAQSDENVSRTASTVQEVIDDLGGGDPDAGGSETAVALFLADDMFIA